MIKIFESHKLQIIFFVLFVFIIAFFTFWRAFNFDFWGEDWEQIWYTVFDPSMMNNPLELREHPIVIYEELFLAKFLGFKTFYWQMAGFLLKVFGAFAVSLMMLGLTKSKNAAFFAGLIFASSVGGLVSFNWVAAHASALIIPFLCIGIYFWVLKRKFILALILLVISILGDVSRGVFGSFVVIFWEILSIIQTPKNVIGSRKRILIMLATLLLIFFIFQYVFNYSDTVSIGYNLGIALNNPIGSLNNFLTNIGGLLIGWIIPIPQDVFAVSKNNIYGSIAGYLFFLLTIFLIIQFLKRRSESLKILLIFSVWIPVFFFPNWLLPNQEMVQNGQVLGVTHRYFTLSAVGLACFLGYVLSKVKKNLLRNFLLLFVIVSNISMSNQILAKESNYRSVEVTKPIWDKIDKDVPENEENSLFFFRGDDKTSIHVFSQAKIAYALRRGINNKDRWAQSSSDPGVIRRYLCGKNDEGKIIPLSHLHAWYIKGNTLENISEEVRKEFSGVGCNSF